MRISDLSRCALNVCAALLLAGCAGGQVVGPSSMKQLANPAAPKSAASQLSGGAFSASYSGHYSVHTCVPCPARWRFRGSGNAKFLRPSDERMNWTFVLGFLHSEPANSAKLTSLHSKMDSIKVTISVRHECNGSNRYKVTGGTGRFAHATGSGTITTTCKGLPRGAYSDQWSGTLYY
jgi:hypothetical protein